MKLVKIIYIANCLIIAILSIALLGASGHEIFILKNSENAFFIFNSFVFFFITLVDIVWFFFNIAKKINPVFFKSLHVLAIILKAILIVKLLPFPSSEDFPKPLIISWIGALIMLAIYVMRKSPFTDR